MSKTKAWAIVDTQKKKLRVCYNSPRGTIDHNQKGTAAIYYKKPTIPAVWRPFKKVVRVTITF